jgi:SEC-C motif-containing protein
VKASKKTIDPCECGSGVAYDACCGRWHAGEAAPTAEALMRSRYVAFVRRNERYVLETWHASTRPQSVEFIPNQKWLGLSIVDAPPAGEARGEVEFIARYRVGGGSAARLHERSRFVKEEGRWFYVEGEFRDSQKKI